MRNKEVTVAMRNKKMMMKVMKTVGQIHSLMRKSSRMIMTMRREMKMAVIKTKIVKTRRKIVMVVIPMNHSQVQKKMVLVSNMKAKEIVKTMIRVIVNKKANMTAKRKMCMSMTVSTVIVQTVTKWIKIMKMKK